MKNIGVLLIIILVALGTVQAQSKAEKRQAKKEAKAQAFVALKTFFAQGDFKFVAEWATTQKGRRINLQSNPNSFIKTGDQATAQLPYFGVAQVAPMGGDVGINIEDATLSNEEIEYNEKKFRLLYSFDTKSSNGELLSCKMTIQANKTAILMVMSSQRNNITYEGTITEIESSKE
ncbi:DUF4251 domain-containing protein [Reichenbachiella carrageenanivorans]|uniref:DUF4251 domain-containing protein n=1 Tax=Reichenbachiella carrageenanivorans TaxID=2979869 RepID=A0ABY6D0A9_9BACT|nr:DUF4251 domain-containing protein [Reichenbachiella carrageenanivorans]UXX79607.1 DUF4251 domain-containing protein [Reichenbachiella carrageenanivorans]